VQVHDDRDVIQAAPDDLPVIDIRSLRTLRPAVGFKTRLRAG
jgi:hypothetical protein